MDKALFMPDVHGRVDLSEDRAGCPCFILKKDEHSGYYYILFMDGKGIWVHKRHLLPIPHMYYNNLDKALREGI